MGGLLFFCGAHGMFFRADKISATTRTGDHHMDNRRLRSSIAAALDSGPGSEKLSALAAKTSRRYGTPYDKQLPSPQKPDCAHRMSVCHDRERPTVHIAQKDHPAAWPQPIYQVLPAV